MLRFVVGPDGDVVPDLKRNLPGRGVWVTADAAHVAQAVKRLLFAKAFKDKVRVSATLTEDIDRLMEQQALQALSICNKAGLVTAGAAKIEKVLGSAPVAALLHATDGSADGVRKMGQLVTRTKGDAAAKLPRVTLFASSQLDLALGRSNVIHAALKTGPAASAFLSRARKYAHYRGAGVAAPAYRPGACTRPDWGHYRSVRHDDSIAPQGAVRCRYSYLPPWSQVRLCADAGG